jgi:hypothetical protein
MRFCAVLSLVLLIITQSAAYADEDKTPENGGTKKKPTTQQSSTDSQRGRKYRVSFELSVEQPDKFGGVTIDGKTEPGRSVHRMGSTLDLSNDELFVSPHSHGHSQTNEHQYSYDSGIEMKVTSTKNDLIRLLVRAKQKTELLEAGESHSWNLILEATKTVKLGEKIKLELGDEKTIGTKCTFEGVIEEKDLERK